MNEVELKLDEKGHGGFYIMKGEDQLAEMEVAVSDSNMTVYHTEVVPEAEGKGLAKKLLAAMSDYARKNGLKVIPLCPYVHTQFKRHPQAYADIWNRQQD